MEKKQELCPIKLTLSRFFMVSVIYFGISILVTAVLISFLKSCGYLKDPLVERVIAGRLFVITGTVSIFHFCCFGNLPSINSSKMSFWDMLVTGITEGMRISLWLCVINFLWKKIFSWIVSFPLEEQKIIEVLRSNLIDEGKLAEIIFSAVIWAPISEEIIFRYFLYRACKSKMSSLKAMLLTSFIFAALHCNLSVFMGLFAFGVFLVLLYERHGNLIPCIIFHGVHNYATILIVILLPDSIAG